MAYTASAGPARRKFMVLPSMLTIPSGACDDSSSLGAPFPIANHGGRTGTTVAIARVMPCSPFQPLSPTRVADSAASLGKVPEEL